MHFLLFIVLQLTLPFKTLLENITLQEAFGDKTVASKTEALPKLIKL